MLWHVSNRNDPDARRLADRHYSRQKPGSAGFVPPGRCLVLYYHGLDGNAVWVTSYPIAAYVLHEWAGAWICSMFRNESSVLSSLLIREAVAATCALWNPPDKGMVTFVHADRIISPNPGYCFKQAGFKYVGKTKTRNYHALQLLPNEMPEATPPNGFDQFIATAAAQGRL